MVSTPFSLSMCPQLTFHSTLRPMPWRQRTWQVRGVLQFSLTGLVWFQFRIHLFGAQSTIGDDMPKKTHRGLGAFCTVCAVVLRWVSPAKVSWTDFVQSGHWQQRQVQHHPIGWPCLCTRAWSVLFTCKKPASFFGNIVLNQNLFWFSWVCPFCIVSQRVILFRAAILGQVVVFWVDRRSTFLSPVSTTIPIQPAFFPCWRDRVHVFSPLYRCRFGSLGPLILCLFVSPVMFTIGISTKLWACGLQNPLPLFRCDYPFGFHNAIRYRMYMAYSYRCTFRPVFCLVHLTKLFATQKTAVCGSDEEFYIGLILTSSLVLYRSLDFIFPFSPTTWATEN